MTRRSWVQVIEIASLQKNPGNVVYVYDPLFCEAVSLVEWGALIHILVIMYV